MSAYAALIVSFLGGIHWGLAFRHTEPPLALLAWGVVPSLVAWVAGFPLPDLSRIFPTGSPIAVTGVVPAES